MPLSARVSGAVYLMPTSLVENPDHGSRTLSEPAKIFEKIFDHFGFWRALC
jgi:hypothetical protein